MVSSVNVSFNVYGFRLRGKIAPYAGLLYSSMGHAPQNWAPASWGFFLDSLQGRSIRIFHSRKASKWMRMGRNESCHLFFVDTYNFIEFYRLKWQCLWNLSTESASGSPWSCCHHTTFSVLRFLENVTHHTPYTVCFQIGSTDTQKHRKLGLPVFRLGLFGGRGRWFSHVQSIGMSPLSPSKCINFAGARRAEDLE